MVNIVTVNFKDLLRFNNSVIYDFRDKVLVAEASKNDLYLTNVFPVRTSFFMFVLMEEGSMQIELDYITHDLKCNDFLWILPEHIFQNIEATDETRYKVIFIDQEYFQMNIGKNDVYKSFFFNIRKSPIIKLSSNEFNTLTSCHKRIKQRMQALHHLKDNIIRILLSEFIIEVENIIIGHEQKKIKTNFTKQELIINDFFSFLTQEIKLNHDVKYYANKLNITPQYLTLILRQSTGKGAKEWIINSLLIEAKIMLKHSGLNIKQISDDLSFNDQSAFGKFFKLNTRITPKEYQTEK